MYVAIWCAYGDWKCTSPFKTEAELQRHIELYLAPKDYNEHITICYIERPAGSPEVRRRKIM